MIKRIHKENLNTKEYLDTQYGALNIEITLAEANERLFKLVGKMDFYTRVLDIGCSNGVFSAFYNGRYPQSRCIGVDLSTKAIELCQKKYPHLQFEEGDVYNLGFNDNFFDMIHMGSVLNHLDKPKEALKEVFRVLAANCPLYLTTTNQHANQEQDHLWHWDVKGIESLLEGIGYIHEVEDPYYNSSMMKLICKKI